MKNYKLEKCPLCGRLPVIIDDQGIGDVYCKHCHYAYLGILYTPMFHFSGKYGIKKKQAIKHWNDYAINSKVMK